MDPRRDLLAAARSLAVDGWTAEAVHALQAAGVDVLLLKGPVLARWLYDAGEERGYGDADLLVAPGTVQAAERVLAGLGYALKDPEGERRMVSGPHARTWLRRADGAVVDLHRTLPGGVPEEDLVWPVLWRDHTTLEVGGADIAVPSTAARLVLVALHAAHHGEGTPVEDLRRATLRVPEPTWAAAADVARAILALPRFADGLALLPESRALARRLRLPSPAELRALEREQMAAGFARLAGARGARERMAILRDKVVPSGEFIRWWAPWARRSRRALAAAYAYRVVWLALHALPGWRAWRRTRRG